MEIVTEYLFLIFIIYFLFYFSVLFLFILILFLIQRLNIPNEIPISLNKYYFPRFRLGLGRTINPKQGKNGVYVGIVIGRIQSALRDLSGAIRFAFVRANFVKNRPRDCATLPFETAWLDLSGERYRAYYFTGA